MTIYHLRQTRTNDVYRPPLLPTRVILRDTLTEGECAKFYVCPNGGDVKCELTTSPVTSMIYHPKGIVEFHTLNSTYLLSIEEH
jgi:hypothetical protein